MKLVTFLPNMFLRISNTTRFSSLHHKNLLGSMGMIEKILVIISIKSTTLFGGLSFQLVRDKGIKYAYSLLDACSTRLLLLTYKKIDYCTRRLSPVSLWIEHTKSKQPVEYIFSRLSSFTLSPLFGRKLALALYGHRATVIASLASTKRRVLILQLMVSPLV